MSKTIKQKRIADYTARLLEGYNSIMAYDDNILSFRFSAYGTLILFNIDFSKGYHVGVTLF